MLFPASHPQSCCNRLSVKILKLNKTIINLEGENLQIKWDRDCAVDHWEKSVTTIDDLKHELEVKESKVKMEKTWIAKASEFENENLALKNQLKKLQ